MMLAQKVRGAIEARLAAIERAVADVDGVSVERRGDAVRLSGRRLAQQSIEDVRLRFAGIGR